MTETAPGAARRFIKMHGAGNDFVVLDLRCGAPAPDRDTVARWADRRRGVGFDQLLTLEPATRSDCLARYRIWNTDGSSAEQCGNGVRCLAAWLHRAGVVAAPHFQLEGPPGVMHCEVLDDGSIRVGMGKPRFEPDEVPFDAPADALSHPLEVEGARFAIGVASMGNPHAVLLVDDVAQAPVEMLGPAIERHPRFPERCNVGFAEIVARDAIRLRVFERGVGETLACGSGACAAVAVLRRRGLLGPDVAVTLPGGTLRIVWPGEGAELAMSGPAAFVFEGTFTA